jgi:hypothetical protein
VAVVLDELPQPEEAEELATTLVAMNETELAQADDAFADALLPRLHDLDVPRAAHRLERAGVVVEANHRVAELLPVAALLPDLGAEDLRTANLLEAVLRDDAPDVLLERADDDEPARMPERRARSGG